MPDSVAHLAFATPSLYVGFENVAGVAATRFSGANCLVIFWRRWRLMFLLSPRSSPIAVAMTPVGHSPLGLAHGVSASAILLSVRRALTL